MRSEIHKNEYENLKKKNEIHKNKALGKKPVQTPASSACSFFGASR